MRRKRRVLGIAILCFTLLSAVIATSVQQHLARIEDRIALDAGMSWQQLHDAVDRRMADFSQQDAALLITRMRAMVDATVVVPTQAPDPPFQFILSVGPWILLSFLLNMLVFFIACVFFLMLASVPSESAQRMTALLPLMVLRMLAMAFLMLLRSFLWIPFVGPFLALYFFPRLALSPAFLASGAFGIVGSVRESLRRTRGRWFGVTLSLFLIQLLAVSVLWIGIVIISLLALFSTKLSFFVWLFLLMCAGALQMFFLAQLGEEFA